MAMALYPDAQKKAQEELDKVIGNRLPEFNDRPNLPYINAMVKESLRWQLVAPLGKYRQFLNNLSIDDSIQSSCSSFSNRGRWIQRVLHSQRDCYLREFLVGPSHFSEILDPTCYRSILHDPEVYKDPFVYNPDRFLKDGRIDPSVQNPTTTFGYGRRICPGRFLAENSLFIFICHIMTVYDIRPGVGDDGKELEIKPEMTNGLLS